MAAITAPPVEVFNKEPETMEEMARLVVVAWVVVERSAMKPPVKVEDAVERKPCKKPRVLEVETPQEVGVQANGAPVPAPSSISQPKRPLAQVKTLLD